MIKYNNSNINDWNYGDDNIVKVYRNNAVCYYKIVTSGDTPTQVPCYAVVDNISQYSDTEFVDVYNKADEKWYKLNNLNQYEEYGVYGSGRTITYYEGKLTIDGSNEYMYSGNSWQNVGEVSGSSRLPQGYTEVEYVENTSSAYINTRVYLYDSTTNSYTIQCKHYFQPYGSDFEYLFGTEGTSSPYVGVNFRYYQRNLQYVSSPSNVTWTHINNGDGTSGITASCSPTNATNGNNPLTLFCGLWSTGPWRFGRGKIYSFTVTKNNTLVRDLVPCKRDSDSMVGMYDLVNDEFYYPPNYTSYQLVAGAQTTGGTEYPIYYDEKSDPPNNLVFSSMTEAEEYQCPWVGMEATINGDDYIFSGDSQSGYEWVLNTNHYLPDLPFSVNYNAKNYNPNTKTLIKTSGQLVDVDAVITAGTPTVNDGYLTITSGTRATISGYQAYFNRENAVGNSELTIVSKQSTDGSNCHMFANRDGNYNWMYRCYNNKLTLHGTTEKGSVAVTTQPVIESVRVYSNFDIKYNNYTDNTSSSSEYFTYGSANNGKFALFQGYGTSDGENFIGDFYWVYMSQNVLTDEQIQQVIDYNENL